MISDKRVGKWIIELLMSLGTSNRTKEKLRLKREKLKSKKKNCKSQMINMFGKTRYYLSFWFGNWILFTCNSKLYLQQNTNEKPYQKFYKDEIIAERYAERLKQKYEQIEITNVFDGHKKQIGYLLIGKSKIITEDIHDKNIIDISKYKLAKIK